MFLIMANIQDQGCTVSQTLSTVFPRQGKDLDTLSHTEHETDKS